MFIGKLSELSGATRKAIRHYEAIGLIAPPERRGTYRVYDQHDLKVITLIRRAQKLGFTLAELQEVVDKKTREKKLPLDLIYKLIDDKALEFTRQAELLLQKVQDLEGFKAEMRSIIA